MAKAAVATEKELTVEEKLKALYELQKINSKIDEIKILRGELPMEVSDLEDEIAGLETRTTKLEEEHQDSDKLMSKYKNNIKEAEAQIKKYEKQQANVKNNREYDALSKEIEMQRLEIQLMDKKIKESIEGKDAKKTYLEESQNLLKSRKKDLDVKKKELDKIVRDTEKEEDELQKKAKKAEKIIDERLLLAFHKIKKTYANGLAVVKYERDSCGGCFAKIPPQRQLEIRQRKKIIVCEHCGRILVDPEIDSKKQTTP